MLFTRMAFMKYIFLLLLFLNSYVGSAQSFFGYRAAVNSYKAHDYASALTQFEELLTEDPDNGELNYNAGKAAYQMQEFQAAASYFSQAANDHEISAELALQAWFDLGNTYAKQKKWQEALESYEKVLTYDASHKEAKDMIEKIKKLLEEQEKQQQNQDQDQNQENQQDQKKDQSSENKQNKQEKKNKDQQDKNNGGQAGQDNEDDASENEHSKDQQENKSGQKNTPKKDDKSSANDQKNDTQNNANDASNNDTQDGKSSQNDGEKQDLNNKDSKQSGQEIGEKSQSDKAKKDSQQRGRDDFENSMPEIQDHERKDTSSDHSASPNQKESNSTKQDTPVSVKAQAARIDPFAINDGIDKESREGKILQAIEGRDAQAAQQLLKMNTQTQRKPGEKNW